MAKSYFSHDSNAKDDPKIIKLIDSLGLEGYGAFWVLIESLREQPNLRLPIIAIPRLSRTFGITQQKLEGVIYHFELFQHDGEFFYSESLINRMMEMCNKFSERTLRGHETRRQRIENQQNLVADAMQKVAKVANESKVNESKLNEIKEDIVSKGDESPTHTKEQIESFKRFQDWIKENAPRVAKMKEPFTIKQYFSLDKEGYNGESIKNLLMNMHNYKPLDKNISAYRTLTNWHKRDQNAK